MHSHAVTGVDVLVEFPGCAEEGVDGCCWAFIPADGELAAFVLEPVEPNFGSAGLFIKKVMVRKPCAKCSCDIGYHGSGKNVPQHEFLGGRRGGISFGVSEYEIEADVA